MAVMCKGSRARMVGQRAGRRSPHVTVPVGFHSCKQKYQEMLWQRSRVEEVSDIWIYSNGVRARVSGSQCK